MKSSKKAPGNVPTTISAKQFSTLLTIGQEEAEVQFSCCDLPAGFVDGEVFTVLITDSNGCTSSDQTTVTVYAEPTATAGNSGPVCYDVANINLSETGGDAVSWAWTSDGSASFSSNTAQNPTISGFADGEIFTVVVTDANGCTSSASTTVTVYLEPTATASNSGPV